MRTNYSKLIDDLNHDEMTMRLESLKKLIEKTETREIKKPPRGNDVNNHIHTTYSFSPYSPSQAVWMAYQAGLETAGIMDHDSVSGAGEFTEAGIIAGIATTIGMECRTDFSTTPLKGMTINHPDQVSTAYVALHGIPLSQIAQIKDFILPFLQERDRRNIAMVDTLNNLLHPFHIDVHYENEVLPLSRRSEGGSVTERHILFALSKKLITTHGRGMRLVDFLRDDLRLAVSQKTERFLLDDSNPFYEYDLLGLLKVDFAAAFYIAAGAECPDIHDFIKLANETGSLATYAYLGDVTASVTGDKKSRKFEDAYLERLFALIKELGFHAVTYMPTRNTIAQLTRVKSLCERYGLLQISGEDINNPRQSFVCAAARWPEFKNLVDTTWALIGHQWLTSEHTAQGLTSRKTIERLPDLNERIKSYKEIGTRYASSLRRKKCEDDG